VRPAAPARIEILSEVTVNRYPSFPKFFREGSIFISIVGTPGKLEVLTSIGKPVAGESLPESIRASAKEALSATITVFGANRKLHGWSAMRTGLGTIDTGLLWATAIIGSRNPIKKQICVFMTRSFQLSTQKSRATSDR
jgi:hypothetical protein